MKLTREQLEELLSAYLDDEVTDQERALVERVMRDDASARRILDELRQTRDLIGALPSHSAPPDLADEIEGHIERRALLDEPVSSRMTDRSHRGPLRVFLGIAAMLVFMVGSGIWFAAIASKKHQQQFAQNQIKDESLTKAKSTAIEAAKVADDSTGDASAYTARAGAPAKSVETFRRENLSASGESKADSSGLAIALEKKLEKDLPVAELKNHSFAAEPVRITLNARSAQHQNALVSIVSMTLRERGVEVVEPVPLNETRQLSKSQAFVAEGTAGANFDDARSRQLIVRAPASALYHATQLAAQGPVPAPLTLTQGTAQWSTDEALLNLQSGLRSQSSVTADSLKLGEKTATLETPVATDRKKETAENDAAPTDSGNGSSFTFLQNVLRLVGVDKATTERMANEMKRAGTAPNGTEGSEPTGAQKQPADQENAESLVERRLRELEEKKGEPFSPTTMARSMPVARTASPTAPPSGISIDDHTPNAPTDDPLITCVVEVVLAPPAANPAPSPEDKTAKPTSPKPDKSSSKN